MERETESKRKQIVKKVAAIFLVLLLVLTFFSNTISLAKFFIPIYVFLTI